MLEPIGFECVEAGGGQAAIDQLALQIPDLVLLDISMSPMDGWGCAAQLRNSGYGFPVVMVSANVFDNRAEQLAAAQCQGFVSKPVRESELFKCIGKTLGLEWVRDTLTPRLPISLESEPSAELLEPELRANLLALLRLGHVQGARRAIEAIALQQPELLPLQDFLADLVDRYELDRCIAFLGVPELS